jgi:hypothetical protein
MPMGQVGCGDLLRMLLDTFPVCEVAAFLHQVPLGGLVAACGQQ